jgi:hypothetical protein
MSVACSTYGERRDEYKVLVEKPEGTRTHGRPRSRWENNIKIDLLEVGWGMYCVDPVQGRDRWVLANAVLKLRVP